MPRAARASVGDQCYHVLNRGNSARRVFFKEGDYQAFLKALAHACIEVPMRVLAWCLMPNHFHLVLWPHAENDLSRWMHWLLNTHVRRYHRHYHSSGHLWQGRFKAFAIAHDEHLLTVLRYVERNALRAGLVERAEQWPWSSLPWWCGREAKPPYWHEGVAALDGGSSGSGGLAASTGQAPEETRGGHEIKLNVPFSCPRPCRRSGCD